MENEEQVPQEEGAEPKEELSMSNPTPTCDAGYYWNATLGKCVLDVG